MLNRLILTLTIIISLAIADNSLESKIAKLQTAPKEQKYKLMNQIKRELAKMNATQRSRALNKLKATIHSSNSQSSKMHNNMKHGSHNMGSHMQNNIKHFMNKTHLHEQINKPIKPHRPIKQGTPKKPEGDKKPGGKQKPHHPKGPHGK